MLKKAYAIIGMVIIIKQMFTFYIPFFSAPLLGRDVNTFLFYLYIILSILLYIYESVHNRKVRVRDFALLIYIFITLCFSLINWEGSHFFLADATMCLMPIAIYIWANYCKISLRFYIYAMCIATIIGGVLSVLIAMKIFDVGIWAAESDFVRAAGAINSTLGVCGFSATIALLFLTEAKFSFYEKVLIYLGLIGSLLIVVFSFSRTRWVICIGVLVVILIISIIKGKKTRFGGFRMVLLLACIVFVVMIYSPGIVNKMFTQMSYRFNLVSLGDHSVSYRFDEADFQIGQFKKNFGLGLGWGSVTYNETYMHNLYTALLMQSGFAAIGYMIWYLSFFVNAVKHRKEIGFNVFLIISILFQLVLYVLNVTNGGIIVSGGYFMLTLVIIVDRIMMEQGNLSI